MSAIKQPDLFLARQVSELPTFRDDIDIMGHPYFALCKNQRTPMLHETDINGMRIKVAVTGADYGIAHQLDGDLMQFLRTIVVDSINRGKEPSRRISFTVYDFLKSVRRGTSGRDYQAFLAMLQRLKATSIITNLSVKGWNRDQGVSWIDSYEIVTRKTARGDIMSRCEVVISEWAFEMMGDPKRNISVNPAYYELTGFLERKLYLIIRKGCGTRGQPWVMELDKLRERCGSTRDLRKFRFDLRKIVERQTIPDYEIELTDHAPGANGVRLVPRRGAKERFLVARYKGAMLLRRTPALAIS